MTDRPDPSPEDSGQSSGQTVSVETASGRSSRVSGRLALTIVIVVALVAGGGLAFAGLTSDEGDDEIVLDVDDVVAEVAPSTVPPRVTTPQPVAELDPSAPEELDTSTDTLSPLAQQLGPRQSAIPEAVTPRPRPIGLQLESIDVARFPIRAVGLELDGQMEIPDETEIGWYLYGATAGQPGATVLAAHVSWNRTVGPFGQLGNVEPGELVEVALDDGTVRRYQVTERAVYGKLELPRERIWRNTGPETLVLITCGGDYNPQIRRYLENIVVYAVPVG